MIPVADIITAAAALWVLMLAGATDPSTSVTFYALTITLGMLSQGPGGLSVFGAVIPLGCSGQTPPTEVLAVLLFYRVIYFLLLLVVTVTMLSAFRLRLSVGAPFGRVAVKLSSGLPVVLTVVVDVMLLVLDVTPASDGAEDPPCMHVPLLAVETSHVIGSVTRFIMLFVARRLLHRLGAVWRAALVLSLLTGVLALPKGIAVSEITVLMALVLPLVISCRWFDRPSSLFLRRLEAGWLLAMARVFATYVRIPFFAYREVAHANQLWWQFIFDGGTPHSIRVLMAVAMTGLDFDMWQLFRKKPGVTTHPSDEEFTRVTGVVHRQPTADATLVLMGDKSLLFSPSDNAFIICAKQERSWVTLSDPVGTQQEWPKLIRRFIEMANTRDGYAAFYKT